MSDALSSRFESGAWQFDEAVAAGFDQHVADNVPHYEVFQETVAHLSDWLAPDGALVADLGAATGTTTAMVSERHRERRLSFVLYDAEETMLQRARAKHGGAPLSHSFRYVACDLASGLDHADADLTLALFTLQFVRPHLRARVLADARDRARRGGSLIVAEKVVQPSALWQEIANEATWDYKAERGADADAIRSKARALRGVLVPLPPGDVERLLVEAGWSAPVPVWRWHNWGLWAASA